MRYNPPPNWPAPPPGWQPDETWQPDPSWPPAPPGWQLWTDAPPPPVMYPYAAPRPSGSSTAVVVTVALVVGACLLGLLAWGVYVATQPARFLDDLASDYDGPDLSGTYTGTSIGDWSVSLTLNEDDTVDGRITYTATDGTTCYGTWSQSSETTGTHYVTESFPGSTSSRCSAQYWEVTFIGSTLYADISGGTMTIYKSSY